VIDVWELGHNVTLPQPAEAQWAPECVGKTRAGCAARGCLLLPSLSWALGWHTHRHNRHKNARSPPKSQARPPCPDERPAKFGQHPARKARLLAATLCSCVVTGEMSPAHPATCVDHATSQFDSTQKRARARMLGWHLLYSTCQNNVAAAALLRGGPMGKEQPSPAQPTLRPGPLLRSQPSAQARAIDPQPAHPPARAIIAPQPAQRSGQGRCCAASPALRPGPPAG
jgi:hypothetical protein